MSIHRQRLAALRAELAARGLDGFVVPLTDEHLSEYVGDYAQRLRWLTGFEGSAGTAAVLADAAAIFVDGRYTLQVREQVAADDWSHQPVPQSSVAGWLAGEAGDDARIGYDPWLHTADWVRATAEALGGRATLVAVDTNPIDAVWADRPRASDAPLAVQPDALAGRSAAEKRQDIAAWLGEEGAETVVLTALDSIAWAFNIRGADVDRTPVALAYALIHADGTADLFVEPEKMRGDVAVHLGNAVRVRPRTAFADALARRGGRTVAVDPDRAVAAISERLAAAGARVRPARDPAVLAKAIKNAAEIAGHRAAQARDGAALARFLHWLSVEAPKGGLTELAAAARLEAFRRTSDALVDLSFDTISAAGPNAAIPHYRVTEASSRTLEPDSIYLVDSGGQYRDGTTDITRTVAIGTPTGEMRDRFTRVLKGHIALATATFPAGVRGSQLDTLARTHLWAAGLDYAHGTGHGVGAFLSVHEGPQRIAPAGSGFAGGDEPLRAGMLISNEPGYYKQGAWGIRIENLVLVVERAVEGAEGPVLGFETMSFAPIDRALVDTGLLDEGERAWLDAYHAQVAARIAPQLEGDARVWLEEACRPLG